MKKVILLLTLTACGDTVVYQLKGTPGRDGTNGSDGFSALVELAPAATGQCANGGTNIVTALDIDRNGLISTNDAMFKVATVCNGTNGQDGLNGQDGADAPPTDFTPVRAIKPCGGASATFKEVILLLADGTLLSSFSETASGLNTRLALLPDGSYVNTDGSACHFTVSTNGNTRSLTWAGGSESWVLQ